MRWNYVQSALNMRLCFEFLSALSKYEASFQIFSAFQHIQRFSYIISAHLAHFLQKNELKRRWHLDPGTKYLHHCLSVSGKRERSGFFEIRCMYIESYTTGDRRILVTVWKPKHIKGHVFFQPGLTKVGYSPFFSGHKKTQSFQPKFWKNFT